MAENEPQETRLVRPVERGGYGLDALWNDGWRRRCGRGGWSSWPSSRASRLPSCRPASPPPHDRATFERCKLDLGERERHAECYALHRDLLRLRREEPAFRAQRKGGMDGAPLTPAALVLRFFDPGGDRLLLVNLGCDLHLVPAPEPLLAPPEDSRWEILWSSEDPRYGGCGAPPPEDEEKGWLIPGHAAVVLRPKEMKDDSRRCQ